MGPVRPGSGKVRLMFDVLRDLFDRDGKKRHGRSSGLRGVLQRFLGGDHDDRRSYRGRYRDDDDNDYYDDRRYAGRRRRYRDDDDDDD